ncbi:MAG: Sulfotransferase family protein [Solirubrobacterales bacterium]|nr:Sulfotransferase family protein [Solirubrobacterales bacterium]
MAIQPIFLFSISRSGSTLIQRIIAAHDRVATASEPWLLLPYAYTLRPRGIDAEYVHPLLVTAIEDFAQSLPEGGDDYIEELRRFALRLYEKAADEGDAYFLDKSPPYCLIAEEIMRLFPEGKFVFLWRNPLSVIASLIDTWGPWRPTFMSSDLFIGLPRLAAAYEKHRPHVHAARFEDLSTADEDAWRELMEYLGIEFDPCTLTDFSKVELRGRMGDPTGRKRYSQLSSEPGQKWRRTLANPIRREWCRRYLRFLGSDRLATMGYDLDRLLADLDSLPPSTESLGSDLWEALRDVAKEPIRVRTRTRRIGSPNVIRELLRA